MTDELIDLMQTFPANGKAIYDGLVKLKLVHANGFSLLLPELIVINIDGWKWFQPKFFSACMISFAENAAYGHSWWDDVGFILNGRHVNAQRALTIINQIEIYFHHVVIYKRGAIHAKYDAGAVPVYQ
ncbi:MAG: hypothetical protein Q8O37_15555 [Sulfuricellaceae bacterium]|nr:hypothetical protein [Sulfuricellaceae bacterium]